MWTKRGGVELTARPLRAAAVALHNLLLTPAADALVAPGETRYAVVIANSRQQTGVVLEHALSLVRSSQVLSHELLEEREHELRFRGNRSFMALPCNSRSVRGLACSAVVFDEMGHYADDDSVCTNTPSLVIVSLNARAGMTRIWTIPTLLRRVLAFPSPPPSLPAPT